MCRVKTCVNPSGFNEVTNKVEMLGTGVNNPDHDSLEALLPMVQRGASAAFGIIEPSQKHPRVVRSEQSEAVRWLPQVVIEDGRVVVHAPEPSLRDDSFRFRSK